MKTLTTFLKQEFNIPESNKKKTILVEPTEIFRVENIKKNISKKITRSSKLKLAVENVLVNDEFETDIDDKIEMRWKKSFSRIKDELLNIDETLNTDRVVLKANRKYRKAKGRRKIREVELELAEYSWYIKLSALCVLVLLLAVSTTTFAPNFSNKITKSFDSAFKASQKGENIVFLKDKIAKKSTVSKKAMSEYIINNRDKLKNLKSGEIIETGLGEQKEGRVAGVTATNKDNYSLFMLFLKKIIKLD